MTMPSRPSWCPPATWEQYRRDATSHRYQGGSGRARLAAEYGLPVIPPTILSIQGDRP